MSARDAFTENLVPRTTFVGGINPWTQEDMSTTRYVTAHLGSSPFTAHKQRPEAKAEPESKPTSKKVRAKAAPSPASRESAPTTAAAPAEAESATPAAKPRTNAPRIDITKLKIRDDVPLPGARKVLNKYAKLFSQLKPKGMIECPSGDVNTIDQSLRKYLRETGKDKDFVVVRAKTLDGRNDIGGVWMWPKSEIDSAKAPNSKAGRATSEKRRAAKAS